MKETQATDVGISSDGKIYIEQYCSAMNEPIYIYLSLEQFKSIEDWVWKNKDEIELAWNGGVSDEADS
jgi:hypothetical protein